MPTLLSNTFFEDLPEVTSTKIFLRKHFHPEGLFSEQIFGPTKNYTCQCKEYYGPSKEGTICERCGVPILESKVRRKRFAKITLPIQVLNPIFYDLLKEVGKSGLIEPLDELMKNEKSVLFQNKEGYYVIDPDGSVPEYVNFTWEKTEGIYELVRGCAEMNYDKDPRWKYIYDNLSNLLTNEILVLPPELRPSSIKVNINELDEINRYYMQILIKKEIINSTLLDIQRDKQLFYQYFRQIQKNVNDLYEQVLSKLKKKEGLIRGHILGKRIDFSGRAVIAPGPNLELDQCKIPYTMFLELFNLDITNKLIELGKFKLLNNAINFVKECIEYQKPYLFDLCKDLIQTNNYTCILNRQPSLHRLSMIGLYLDISLEHVIRLHPLACDELNADHDGDSLNGIVKLELGENKNEITIEMENILGLDTFDFKSRKTKNETTITKYSPNQEIHIKAINPQTGKTDWKNVSEFSVHENLNMYQLEDPKNRFKTFWASEDHSLLIFDENDGEIKKVNPKKLKEQPEGKYLIQEI